MEHLYSELDKPEVKEMYFNGLKNQAIRLYFYLRQGLELLNDFKYLLAGILAIYYTLKLDGYGALILMFIVSVPLLTLAGFVWTHRAKKTIEYFNLKFTTHFQQYGLNLQEKQLEILNNLNDNIKQLNESLKK